MKKPVLLHICLTIITTILIVTGCKTATPDPIQPTTTSEFRASETEQPIGYPSPTKAPATETPTLTPSIHPKPTKTFTAKPTTTVLPTLSVPEAQKLVSKLLQDNGGCSFPCWFGFTPGISSFSETRAFVASFARHIQKNGSKDITIEIPDLPGYEDTRRLWGRLRGEKNDGFTSIAYHSPIDYSSLPTILSKHGLPDEIRIWAEGSYMGLSKYGTFWIVLYYKEKGIMVEYEGETDKGDTLAICFSPERLRNYTRILLWNPNIEFSFSEAGKLLGLSTRPEESIEKGYKSLSEISDIDAQSFYERYRLEENRDKCFYVPDRKD